LGFFNKIKLENYRNFKNFDTELSSKCNILIGKNGSGKTNILESISLFEKGRGLRKDSIKNLINNKNQKEKFNVYSTFSFKDKEIDLSIYNENKNKDYIKKISVNNSTSSDSLSFFENLFSIIYFLPEMERLFVNSKSLRRNFFDRLIFSTDKDYNKLVNRYKKNILERSKILRNSKFDNDWIKNLEIEIVKSGVEIYKKRISQISILNSEIEHLNFYKNNNYKIFLNIDDEIINNRDFDENYLTSVFLENLEKSREIDSFTGGCKFGPHKSDFFGYEMNNNLNLNQLSTGQQKTIILLIIIAHCNYLLKKLNKSPILLFDEICSHLDNENRNLLLELIENLNIQILMTGTEKNLFSFLSTKGTYCNIT